MVIPELLSLNVRVISVDCEAGPREILKHEYNGLLVKNYNVQALAGALIKFIKDARTYNTYMENAFESVEKFSITEISKQWKNLIQDIDIRNMN
jgi:glycosyltransferase involved in cell wall biosynthesis